MEIKKVKISMKNPENYPIKGFAQVKKITTHIFQKELCIGNLCTVLHSGQFKDQKSLDLHNKNPALCPDCEASLKHTH